MDAIHVELDIAYHVENAADDSERFEKVARWIAQRYGIKSLVSSIAIVDDPTIHELNREHLDHDWPTDVISFVFEMNDACVDGEIIASFDTARKLSEAAGWSAADELLLYVIHGLLHLVGLDDIDESDRQKMRLAEQECLHAMEIEAADNHLKRWENVSY